MRARAAGGAVAGDAGAHRRRAVSAATAAALTAACAIPVATLEAGPPEIAVGVVATPGSVHRPDGGEVGQAVADAIEAAKGGHASPRFRLVPATDDCTRTSAEETARRLVAEGVRVVIGHVCANAAVAAAPVYAAGGVLMIAPGVRHPRLTEKRAGPLVFRLAGRTDRQARDMARLAEARHAGRKLAIVHDRSAESRAEVEALEKALGTRKPVLKVDFSSGEKSYRGLAQRIAGAEIEVMIMPAQPVELGVLLDDLAAVGHRVDVIAGEPHAVPDLEPVAARHGDRITLMLGWPGVSQGQPRPRLAAPSLPALARVAAEALADAARRAHNADAAALALALVEREAPTSVGPVRFDANGDADVPSFLPHRWREGGWQRF